PLYHSITDYCPHGVWQCGQNPRSAQVFREFLSAGRGGRAAGGPPRPGGLPGGAAGRAGDGVPGTAGREAAGPGALWGGSALGAGTGPGARN
ncbi:hypothetical protein ACFW6V_39045, partial [Streptomyces sp. NPDC058734]